MSVFPFSSSLALNRIDVVLLCIHFIYGITRYTINGLMSFSCTSHKKFNYFIHKNRNTLTTLFQFLCTWNYWIFLSYLIFRIIHELFRRKIDELYVLPHRIQWITINDIGTFSGELFFYQMNNESFIYF